MHGFILKFSVKISIFGISGFYGTWTTFPVPIPFEMD